MANVIILGHSLINFLLMLKRLIDYWEKGGWWTQLFTQQRSSHSFLRIMWPHSPLQHRYRITITLLPHYRPVVNLYRIWEVSTVRHRLHRNATANWSPYDPGLFLRNIPQNFDSTPWGHLGLTRFATVSGAPPKTQHVARLRPQFPCNNLWSLWAEKR